MDQLIRNSGISGSRAAAIYNAHPFMTQFDLRALILGEVSDEHNSDTRQLLGQCLEPGILEVFGKIHGVRVIPNSTTFRHPDIPIVVGTPDGFIEGENTGIDAKVIAPDSARAWGSEATDIPEYILIQAYWYMALMGYAKWIIAALVAGWLRFYTIHEDRPLQARMIELAQEWWDRFIVKGELPPFTGSPRESQWLQRAYPRHHPPVRLATPEEQELLDRYVTLRVGQMHLNAELAVNVNTIKAAIGDGEGLKWDAGAGVFTWRKPKNSRVTDWKSMAIALLYNFVKEDAERADLLSKYTRDKENSRRIHVKHPLLTEESETKEEDKQYA